MKKYLLAITMLAVSAVIMSGMSNPNSDKEKERIETVKKVVTGGLIPRSVDSYVIDGKGARVRPSTAGGSRPAIIFSI